MKILPVRAGLFHEEGQTDKMKLIVAIRNSAKATKIIDKIGEFRLPPQSR